MARYHIDATWHDGYVHVDVHEIRALDAQQAGRLVQRGLLGSSDEPVARMQIGEIRVTEPAAMTPKRVKSAVRAWLAERVPDATEIEWQFAVRADLDALARLEAAVGA